MKLSFQAFCESDSARPILIEDTTGRNYLIDAIIPSIVDDESWSNGQSGTYWTDIIATDTSGAYVFTWGSNGRGK